MVSGDSPIKMATHGRQSTARNGGPTYDPRELLNPQRRAPVPPLPSNGSGSNSQSGTSTPEASSYTPMMFQFSAPNGVHSEGPSSGAPTPPANDATAAAAGLGMQIENLHNVQARTEAPEAKRRRVDPETEQPNGTKMPVRGGSGILGQYVKDKRQESSGASTPQSMMVDLTDGNDDDDVVTIGNPRDEEVCYGLLKTSLNCSIVPSAKPGTQSIWGTGYHPFVKVVLKRQAGDKTNRIQAYDHTRQVIGQVDAASAVALSPLIDSRISMRTECRLPSQPRKEGEEPGLPTSRTFNLDITMYGPMKYAKNIGGWLSKHNLRLLGPTLVQKGIRVHNPHVREFQPPPPKTYTSNAQGYYASSTARTVEEIKSEIMGVFDSLTRSEDLPMAEPDSSITTPLLKHQKQGLYFMQAREALRHTASDEKHMTSLWKTKTTASREKHYYNVITQHTQKETPPETRGGILADMMGLGKTLSILSLVVGSREESREWASCAVKQPTAPETKASRHDSYASQTSLRLTPLLSNVKTTLLVCPLSTVTNWEEQIKLHLAERSLNYHIYHGANRTKDPKELAKFDLVITTYGSVSNELSSRNKGKDGQYPLEQLGWFRIVLDEAHMIREQATLQFKSIIRLQAQRRWAVTGTPVQNRLEDLASLLAFLRLHPFEHRSKFTRYIVEPFKVADPEVVPKLRILVDTVTLRRLKDKIDLPSREDLVVRLKFSPEEQGVYDIFAKNAKDRVKALAGSNTGQALGGSTYIHILKSILRLRLLCAHGKDLLNEEDLASLQGMSAEMAIDIDDDDENGGGPALSHRKAHEMFALMQETNNDACSDCGRKIGASDGANAESENTDDVLGFMTPCFHVLCSSCISTYQERAKEAAGPDAKAGPCPTCQSYVRFDFVQLKRSDIYAEHEGPPQSSNKPAKKKFDNYAGPHSKTKALVEDLLKAKAQTEREQLVPPIKSVVFSGWTSHLDLIEMALKSNNINFTRLDGGMTRTARTAAMDRFREDDSVEVILVSIMAGGLGLNLTTGSNVYVMEPQYNPAAEAQAIDRVHRLGQKRPVRTIRYIMSDSFEEKMLELQEKKKKLATLSMDGQSKPLDKSEAARQKLADLRSLFK